ncbi:MAG: hypothetical protein ACYSWP_23365 [Planctomycetota bacterium]|jgi:hypothetical protein
MKINAKIILIAFVLLANSLCFGADWPQFRGLNRDGKSPETGLMKEWPQGGPKMLWSVEGLGIGFSSAAIADGRIFTTGMDEKNDGIILQEPHQPSTMTECMSLAAMATWSASTPNPARRNGRSIPWSNTKPKT